MAKFTNFGRLYLKKIHSCCKILIFHIKVEVIPLPHTKLEKNLSVGR